jgi:serine/threonine protein kinase
MSGNNLIGQSIGRYRVLAQLGQGGTARVFKAFDELHARDVALKVLPIVADDRAAFMQRFERESEVIRSLHHPNIVEVYDSDQTDEFVYLVLRLLNGESLRSRIVKRSLSIQSACQYMIQIALALHHAHRQGIIHRDVKPSNMLFDPDQPEHILLTDFGTAKILNARGLTRTGATLGTAEYMSPEQAQGLDVDQRSDIYSLGCALYEALSGQPPFVGEPIPVLYQQVHVQPTYIRSLNSDVPPGLWHVLRKCLLKRPDDRYGSAAILAEELRPFAEGLIQPTPPPWRAPETARFATNGLADPNTRVRREPTSLPLPPSPPLTPPSPPTADVNRVWSMPLDPGEERAPASRPQRLGPRGPEPILTIRSTAGPVNSGLLTRSGAAASAMTSEQKKAVDEYSAQLEIEEPWAAQAQPGVPYPDHPTMPTPVVPQWAQTSGPVRAAPSGPVAGQQWRGETDTLYRSPPSGGLDGYLGPASGGFDAYPGPASGVFDAYPGMESNGIGAPRRAITSSPMVVGALRDDYNQRTRIPRRRPISPLAPIGVVVVALLVAVALGMGGVKLFAQQGAPAHATPRPTATVTAHATATATIAQPTATATLTAQQTLNQQAASAFRAITLAPFSDGSCSSASATTHFTGSPVYVNLCMARSRPPGSVTVVVRHDGATIRTLFANMTPSAGAFYTAGHTLSPGSYDMLVTMQISGKQAVAQDIAFIVH